VYGAATRFAGCTHRFLRLEQSNRYIPDFSSLPDADLDAATICFLNYPNNPTGACVSERTFRDALRLGKNRKILIVNDAAYADVYSGDDPPPLLCAQPGASEMPMIEFFSFSKSFSITGWRVGFAVGRRDVIEALAHLKANLDSGVFGAIQEAVSVTLETGGTGYADKMRSEYSKRRDRVVGVLDKLGFQTLATYATFYIWARVPEPFNSMDYALHLLENGDVLVTPGTGFGEAGEGYFRIALTQPVERIEEALRRIERL
jgi:LL-diaminopimelate aminotransferase